MCVHDARSLFIFIFFEILTARIMLFLKIYNGYDTMEAILGCRYIVLCLLFGVGN